VDLGVLFLFATHLLARDSNTTPCVVSHFDLGMPAAHTNTLRPLCLPPYAARSAVLSTISSHPSSAGFPFGSVVEFAVDASGHPLLSTSTLSPHTADLQADGRCSITVMAPGFSVSGGHSVLRAVIVCNCSRGEAAIKKHGQQAAATSQHHCSSLAVQNICKGVLQGVAEGAPANST
jgi:hypothetical protein